MYSKLQILPKSCNKFAEIQHTSDSIEKILRQLEAQGEAVNSQRMLIQLRILKDSN